MTSEQRSAALKAIGELKDAGFSADELKGLAMVSDKSLATLHTLAAKTPADAIIQAKAAADAALAGHAHGLKAMDDAAAAKKAADDKKKADDAAANEGEDDKKMKAASAAGFATVAEHEQAEFYKKNPEIKALVDRQKEQDKVEKQTLVTKLAAASKALTVEQLAAKPLEELRTLAQFAKVEASDFSIKGMPQQRNAENANEFEAPDPYNLKALQTSSKAAH